MSNANVQITGTCYETNFGAWTFAGTGTVFLEGGTATGPNLFESPYSFNFFYLSLTLDSSLVNNGYTVVNADVYLASDVTLTNSTGATWVSEGGSQILPQSGATGESFINNGTLLATISSVALNTVIDVPLTNTATGIVDVANSPTFGGVGDSSLTLAGGGVRQRRVPRRRGHDTGLREQFQFCDQSAAAPDSAIDAPNVTFGGGGTTVVGCSYTVPAGR